MKLFSALINKAHIGGAARFACIWPLFHRCQECQPVCAIPMKRLAPKAENGKPVCYDGCVGGNLAPALFDMVRQ